MTPTAIHADTGAETGSDTRPDTGTVRPAAEDATGGLK